jgi:hypothetical protein
VFAWLHDPSAPISPIPIGAFEKAARKRSSLPRRAAVFWYSSTNVATFERSTSGS